MSGTSIGSLRERLHALGAQPVHVERVLRQWARAEPQSAGRRRPEHFLPLPLRHALARIEAELRALAVLRADHAGADGARRLLVGLADGRSVEAVLLPRGGLCVSTQVGCAVGCSFCMTGVGGLERQLGSAEIVAQVALARSLRPVTKVVFMGMGEPSHNLEAVLEAIDLLGSGGGIGHKNLVFSTVGDRRAFARLPQQRVKPALALSLHSTDPVLRAPDELVALGDAYARATGYPMQVQWTLLAGINDGADELEGLVRLLAGRHAVLNLIPWNDVPGLPFARPPAEHAQAMARELHRRGVLTKLRKSAGQDVEAGCGQLRARDEAPLAFLPLPRAGEGRGEGPAIATTLTPPSPASGRGCRYADNSCSEKRGTTV
jgi:23S rRNA (adenine2503-C2)-methyltransferase